ncbi:hypothetical protein [Desulfofundulus sp.]
MHFTLQGGCTMVLVGTTRGMTMMGSGMTMRGLLIMTNFGALPAT